MPKQLRRVPYEDVRACWLVPNMNHGKKLTKRSALKHRVNYYPFIEAGLYPNSDKFLCSANVIKGTFFYFSSQSLELFIGTYQFYEQNIWQRKLSAMNELEERDSM